ELARDLNGALPEGFPEPSSPSPVGDESEAGGEPSGESAPEMRRRRQRYPEIVGRDDSLMRLLGRIDQVADSDSPALVQGESGTGKELVAEALHRRSGRGRDGEPFVKVNCGAFVDNLLMSELFGHEKGAFTGAVEQKRGCFERADGGTIFLDEIGEVSPKAQVALLRALQEGEFERVGGSETHSVDVRVVCATNRDLAAMVEEENFRLDLYYRLKGVVLEVPPLRERRGDIPMLARHFAGRASDGGDVEFSREVLEFLASYRWPGNVRELQHLVETVLLFVDGQRVEMAHLREFEDFFAGEEIEARAPEIDYDYEPAPAATAPAHGGCPSTEPPSTSRAPEESLVDDVLDGDRELQDVKAELQRRAVRRALEETGGNITQAAELLEMSRPRVSQIVNGDDELLALKEQLVA
ncbi:MAG: sigma-54 interaction domain-containing protein, partial [Bradymonadaceae bacterium]